MRATTGPTVLGGSEARTASAVVLELVPDRYDLDEPLVTTRNTSHDEGSGCSLINAFVQALIASQV